MNVLEASEVVKQALLSPVETWPRFTPASTPIAIFDKDDVAYLNHPAPPQDRPVQLQAATAIDINGYKTATIPVEICPDEQSLIPLVYHECFHVFQENEHFHFNEQYNFFKALSYYPELNATYRAACVAETHIINHATLSIQDKARFLAALAKQRFEILANNEGLLAFEANSERREGTASFVEQQACAQIFNKPLNAIPVDYGWSRQYSIGAAICWLLESLVDSWQAHVESGHSPTNILIQEFARGPIDLSALQLPDKVTKENEAVHRIHRHIRAKIEEQTASGVLRIQLLDPRHLLRAFSPKTILSLGDGRLIHTEFLKVQMPSGNLSICGEYVIEDLRRNELILPTTPFKTANNKVEADSDTIRFSFKNAVCVSNNVIQVT